MPRRDFTRSSRWLAFLAAPAALCAPAWAWNAFGHRLVTELAVETMPSDAPAWIIGPEGAVRAAYGSVEPDRWRGTSTIPIGHENKPDHYIDAEDLDAYGLSLRTLPRFRYDYVEMMALARAESPEAVPPYDEADDRERAREWPGFLPYAIAEHYAKLESSFRTVRLLEAVASMEDGPRVGDAELEQARANALFHMGTLSHFVGDAAQPLHTTRHFNGWAGDNPEQYTTDRGFHAKIDGGVLAHHGIDAGSVRPLVDAERAVDGEDVWSDTLSMIERSLALVEPLYALEKHGALERNPGRSFIERRLADAAGVLGAMYRAAWTKSAPSDEEIERFVRYEERR